jgi:hypothetical protein
MGRILALEKSPESFQSPKIPVQRFPNWDYRDLKDGQDSCLGKIP